ncbi:phosphatidylglycerophosphatase A family protein [Candidatus Bandiella euplotis]|uniref:Phosphatidylglycerophosphatase A n=1 Tax=Candidatus Bandiella euplotis TaxID=1664265 RepID=A0ABZ0UIN9_9RICK|nr:phosphatidylglycerophosphatase A [Candidatus Bandiella woodruffii]WPX95948.1 Phosphatidylglycerophosphatase A [Candidatus Bandiella woodruffii]
MAKKKFNFNNLVNTKAERFTLPFAWYSIISTWFFVGKLPFAPGTFGSIAAYPLYYYILMHSYSSTDAKLHILLAIITLFIIVFFAIDKFQRETGTYDHSYVVIDEVIGQLLTLYISFDWAFSIAYALQLKVPSYALSFVIAFLPFRYFDISKPLLIGYVNKNYKGAFGVIFDDILAAVCASGVLYVASFIFSYLSRL